MKQFLTIVFLVGSISAAIAQGPVTSDPAAKKILDAASAKLKSFKAVQASFTIKIEDAKDKVQGTQKGTVYMKGVKYRATLAGKENKEVFCDGNTTWTFDKATNEVTITKFDPTTKTITPQSLLTNFYDKDFLYKFNGEKKEGPRMLQEIELTPVDKTKNFHKVYVYVDKGTQTIYSGRVLDKSGNKFTYTINSMNGKAVIPDQMFVYDKSKFPGAEEVDLR